jgi:hypothetical protein
MMLFFPKDEIVKLIDSDKKKAKMLFEETFHLILNHVDLPDEVFRRKLRDGGLTKHEEIFEKFRDRDMKYKDRV